jgi:hypothetical protein
MRYFCITYLAVVVLSSSAYADWKAEIVPIGINNKNKRSVLVYYADAYRGTKSIGTALEGLAKSGNISILQTMTVHDLIEDEAFQKETFGQLEKIAPDALRAAKRSAGNMHNPKMKALSGDFAKAVLTTPTVSAISAALATYGFKVLQVESEKLEFHLTEEGHQFRCFLWLFVEPIH